MKGFTNKWIVIRVLCALFLAMILIGPEAAHAADLKINGGGSITYAAAVGGETITVTLNGASKNVVCQGKPSWVTNSSKDGNKFTLKIAANSDTTSRSGDVVFTDGGAPWRLRITQNGQTRTYTVSFTNTGDTYIAPITVTYGKAYGSLPVPSKTGYSFQGWFTTNANSVRIIDSTIVSITSNQTLSAHWSANCYTVYFDSAGGSAVSSKSVYFDNLYGALPSPTRTGYNFAGWYTGGGASVDANTKMTMAYNHTLYARWSPKQITVRFSGFASGLLAQNYTVGTKYGSLPGGPDPAAGYKFVGWFTDPGNGTQITTESIVPTGDITLYPHWAPRDYTVTFDTQGGNEKIPQKFVTYRNTYGTLQSPTKAGYTFAGWYTKASGGSRIYASTTMTTTRDITLYAHWTPNTYTVEFNSRGGTAVSKAKITVTYGGEYGQLETPTRTGYKFAGWYTAASGGTKITATSKVSTASNHTLYAHWSPKQITVKFFMGNGVFSSLKYTVGEPYETLPGGPEAPAGYYFAGWYTKSSGGTQVTVTSKVPTTDTILYPQTKPKTFTITFDSQGGNSIGKKTVTYLETYGTLQTPKRAGYTFNGWYTKASGGTKITADSTVTTTKNQKLYAHWTAKTFTVTFDSQGGSDIAKKKVTFDSAYDTLTSPTRKGYKFAGWYTAASGGTKVTAATIVNTAGNHTLYAHWKARNYTVSFDSQGGSTVDNITVTYDSAYGTLVSPTRKGFKFAGWYDAASGGNKITAKTIVAITANQTLYAHWQANKYTVTFDSRGGSAVAAKTVTYSKKYGVLEEPTRPGYSFVGWFTAATDGTQITADTTVKITAGQTLYARWTLAKFKITFDSRGGSSVAVKTVKYTKQYGTLTTPTRDGYTFVGWFTKASGGTQITESTKVTITADQKLYAHWTANTYTVKFDSRGGSKVSNMKVVYGNTYGKLPSPTKEGYKFQGWYTKASGGNKIAETTKVQTASTHTLYAHWTEDSCVVEFHFLGDDYVHKMNVTRDSVITMPEPFFNMPGIVFGGWTVIGQTKTWSAKEKYKVTQNMTFYASTWEDVSAFDQDDPNQLKTKTHDFTGFSADVTLKNTDFISNTVKDRTKNSYYAGQFGFSQGYFSGVYKENGENSPSLYPDAWRFQWELYISKHGEKNTERAIGKEIQSNKKLQEFLRSRMTQSDYANLIQLMKDKYPKIVDSSTGDVCWTESPDAFSVIDKCFKDNERITNTIRQFYGLEMKDFFDGSCGIFAAVNTYLYLKGNETNTYEYSEADVEDALHDYIAMTKGVFDWLERIFADGEGIKSMCTFLQTELKSRGCNAKWKPFELVTYDKINTLLRNNIPVIMAFYRSDKAALCFYWKNSNNQLIATEAADGHYFVVTGTYSNPNMPDKHFLEVSTWGVKRYICLEEYLYGKGSNLFSSYMEITFSK